MSSIFDKLPAGARTSTTGQGLAGIMGTATAIVAGHNLKLDADTATAIGTIVGCLILLFFPQQGAAPMPGAAAVSDVDGALEVIKKTITAGDTAKASLTAIAAPKP